NLNHKYPNNSAIDLGDETAKPRVCYQVTSVTKKAKVQATLKQFVTDNWHQKYDHLRVLMLSKPQGAYKGLTVDKRIVFSPSADIISLTDLVSLAGKADEKLAVL